MTASEIIALITAVILGLPVFVGAIAWINSLQARIKGLEARIGDLKTWMQKTESSLEPLASLPEVLKGLSKDISHGLEMMSLEFKAMNARLVEHTSQDEIRFDRLDERQENLSRQMGHVITGGNDRFIEIRRAAEEDPAPRQRAKRKT